MKNKKLIIKILFSLFLILLISSIVLISAFNSTPSSLFYNLHKVSEDLTLTLTSINGDQSKYETYLSLAQKRISDLESVLKLDNVTISLIKTVHADSNQLSPNQLSPSQLAQITQISKEYRDTLQEASLTLKSINNTDKTNNSDKLIISLNAFEVKITDLKKTINTPQSLLPFVEMISSTVSFQTSEIINRQELPNNINNTLKDTANKRIDSLYLEYDNLNTEINLPNSSLKPKTLEAVKYNLSEFLKSIQETETSIDLEDYLSAGIKANLTLNYDKKIRDLLNTPNSDQSKQKALQNLKEINQNIVNLKDTSINTANTKLIINKIQAAIKNNDYDNALSLTLDASIDLNQKEVVHQEDKILQPNSINPEEQVKSTDLLEKNIQSTQTEVENPNLNSPTEISSSSQSDTTQNSSSSDSIQNSSSQNESASSSLTESSSSLESSSSESISSDSSTSDSNMDNQSQSSHSSSDAAVNDLDTQRELNEQNDNKLQNNLNDINNQF